LPIHHIMPNSLFTLVSHKLTLWSSPMKSIST
jgi:hypothetical protein